MSGPAGDALVDALARAAAELVLADIAEEYVKAVHQIGAQSYPDGTGGHAAAYGASVAHALCHLKAERGDLTWWDLLAGAASAAGATDDPDRLREGLVRVAALCTQWISDLDRRDRHQHLPPTTAPAYPGRTPAAGREDSSDAHGSRSASEPGRGGLGTPPRPLHPVTSIWNTPEVT